MTPFNLYGDQLITAGPGYGADIASQRMDELDLHAIQTVATQLSTNDDIAVLDLGAGRGAQADRLLQAGAKIAVACDIHDFSPFFYNTLPLTGKVKKFLTLDISEKKLPETIRKNTQINFFDIIVFQRTIHYFPAHTAQNILQNISQLLKTNGHLYLSASGLPSELSENYPAAGQPLANRFCELSPHMQTKHGILGAVCLYNSSELTMSCEATGLHVLHAQESPFGNIKIIARKK